MMHPGAVRPILTMPHDALRTVCAPVTAFDAALSTLADDLLSTMYGATGRGLAAPQVGVLQRVFVMDVTWKSGTAAPRVCVNPRIIAASDDRAVGPESCLSLPGTAVDVTRAVDVTLLWQDLAGTVQTAVFSGIDAVIVQHESDHLDGILCSDPGRAA